MKHFASLLIITLMFFTLPTNAAGVKRWVDGQGRIHYGERAPTNSKASTVKQNISVIQVNPQPRCENIKT